MPQRINTAGLDLIRRFEGCKLVAYPDAVGVHTLGFGHTRGVHQGDTCTQAQADQWLLEDVQDAEENVAREIRGMELNPNQFSACVALCYNIGSTQFNRSTLHKYLNIGDIERAAEEFHRWNKAGGSVLPGLVRRRQAEEELFRRPIKPLSRSRTLAGGQIAAGATALTGLTEGLQQSQDMLYGLAAYLPWARYALLAVIAVSVGVMMWARISDHLKSVR